MLILTRRVGETLMVGEDVTVTVLAVKGNQVRIGINAPKDVAVHREDHQGGVSAITSNTGGLNGGESFTAFGQHREPTTWSGAPSQAELLEIATFTRQGYTFQTSLGQSMGLNHMNGRVQDAVEGRFISPDPIIQDSSNAQNYNRYTYALSNPLTLIDPTGFDDCDDADGLCPIIIDPGSTYLLPGITVPSGSTVTYSGVPGQYIITAPDGTQTVVGLGGKPAQSNNSTTVTVNLPTAQSPNQTQSRCWNASASSTIAGSGPVAGPVGLGGSGGTGVGFSWGGDLLNSGPFLQFQAAGIVGTGTYAGWSVTFSGSNGSIPDYVNSTMAFHNETNIAVGVGGGYSFDVAPDGSTSVSGYRGGLGGGAASGVGGSLTTTVPLFTIGQLLQFLGIPLSGSYPFSCH